MSYSGMQSNPNLSVEKIRLGDELYNAQIQHYLTSNPDLIKKVTYKLDTKRDLANPIIIGFPFQGLYIQDATDSATEVSFTAFDRNEADQSFPLRLKDTLNFDIPIARGKISFEKQVGKEVTILYILKGSFRPGSQLSEVSTSVEGNTITVLEPKNITTAASELVPQNNNRSVLNLISNAPFRIAGSLTATYWYPMPASTQLKLKNTAAIYAKTLVGSATIEILEEA